MKIKKICDECNSEFFEGTSKMENLCPECCNILYGYPNCEHYFENGRCIKCNWNGNQSDYIKKLKENNKNVFKNIIRCFTNSKE